MLKRTMTTVDFNGVTRVEDFYFNLTESEVLEMEMGTSGGYQQMITNIINSKDVPSLVHIFKTLVLKAYGEKSLDGKYFNKTDIHGNPLSIPFSQTQAYSDLFMELATDDKAASEFVNGIMPNTVKAKLDTLETKDLTMVEKT